MPLPACDAVIVHVPTDTYVTSAPDTVHTPVVLDIYDTGNVDDAVAALAADAVGTSVCIEVAGQAVANAIRQGHATTVSLRLLPVERDVQVSISADGASEPSATIRMGTQVLMDCSTHWSRHSSKNGTLLEAHIPVTRNATSYHLHYQPVSCDCSRTEPTQTDTAPSRAGILTLCKPGFCSF